MDEQALYLFAQSKECAEKEYNPAIAFSLCVKNLNRPAKSSDFTGNMREVSDIF